MLRAFLIVGVGKSRHFSLNLIFDFLKGVICVILKISRIWPDALF